MYTKFFIALSLFSCVLGSPKKYMPEDEMNFQPSSNRYFEYNLHSSNNHTAERKSDQKESKSASDKLRFGLPIVYGSTGSGAQSYPQTGGVSYMVSPMKLDIGGVALGALIGLGAILILPKLAHAFGGLHGGYRSYYLNVRNTLVLGLDDGVSSVSDMLSRLDNTLEQNNIDSSSCMQRIVCNYIHESRKNIENGEASAVDEIIGVITNNSLVSQLLDGSSIKQAVDMGKSTDTDRCSSLYRKCPVDKDNIVKVITSILPV
ncbi:uncharacterized protein LOC123306663 [Coccinella septempunctata]|uniref:uncharacterized protein LOC123306663 n=1 Tax=Coccinella septempunctata TaxID=41139 RepID=UPI001D084344|nr:uncharacterized protein LOC123306663 [Coccinella septempunctata]